MYSSIELSFIKHSVGLYWRVNILTAIKTQTIEFMIESRTKESIQSVLHARSLIWKVRPKRTWTIRIHVCLFIFLYFIELGYLLIMKNASYRCWLATDALKWTRQIYNTVKHHLVHKMLFLLTECNWIVLALQINCIPL